MKLFSLTLLVIDKALVDLGALAGLVAVGFGNGDGVGLVNVLLGLGLGVTLVRELLVSGASLDGSGILVVLDLVRVLLALVDW